MKGVMLPISTIVILVLAVLVLVVLLVFFTMSSTPAMDLVMLKQKQAILCSSYQQNNPDCTLEGHNDMETTNANLLIELGKICCKLSKAESGYPSCAYIGVDCNSIESVDDFKDECAKECCRMYCGEESD